MHARNLMWILWPSFLMAGAASAVVFALVDPLDVVFLGYLRAGRLTVYTVGFFIFWIMAALSSALTLRIAPRGVELDEFGDPVE
ncbi:Transmembrane protein [Castellaniella defragrans 65Phen]|uniref:Transmembrane protein n=3 Tax=Castellaniella defragrans TaxID=75697 RepID=W8X3R9_CASD6|nr:hypothetical protein [Castellaniella defragrans]MBB6082804.1 hypothetical protein [Castellaniella defragrans]CDM23941.1 Transmembrane protein [Castellaniella defragrans 65Phen]